MSGQNKNPRPSSPVSSWILEWVRGLGLIAAVFFVYQTVWNAGCIWDDDTTLINNGTIVGPFGLKEIWTTSAANNCPFTLTTLWLIHKMWGLNPLAYHLISLCFHALNAVVLWRVLRALAVPWAWLGAALWAVHPVQVESVAWISEMKSTESGLFYLLSMLFFLKWQRAGEGHGVRFYPLALVFAGLAMASSSVTVILPLQFCLALWWTKGGVRETEIGKLAPFFVFALIAGIASVWMQHIQGADNPQWLKPLSLRIEIAGGAVWFYFAKLFWPYPLMMIYPENTVVPDIPFEYLPLLAAIATLIVLWFNRRTWGRPWFFMAASFVIALLPVLGLINGAYAENSPVYDHLQYLASMAPLALAGALIAWLAGKMESAPVWIAPGIGVVMLIVFGFSSLRYAQVFQNETTLWSYELTQNPNSSPAYTNLAIQYGLANQPQQALDYFKKAVALDPKNVQAQNDLGLLLEHSGQADEAMQHFKAALAANPNYPHAHANVADMLAAGGHLDDAIQEYDKALVGAPNEPEIQVGLGVALAQQGRPGEAVPHFQKAVEINPKSVEAQYNLGNALFATGLTDAAIDHYKAAEELSPNEFRIHNNLGRALAVKGWLDDAVAELRLAAEEEPKNIALRQNLGRLLVGKGEIDEGILQMREAVKLDDHDARNHNMLGMVLQQAGKLDEAITEYQKALAIDPAFAECRRNLGFAYLQQGKGAEAADQFERSLALDPKNVPAHNNLGIIYGQRGDYARAKEQFQLALQIQPNFEDAQRNLKRVDGLLSGKVAK